MQQQQTTLTVATRGKGLYNFTRDINRWIGESGLTTGLLTIFVQHTSCSLTIQENADPDVQVDMVNYFDRLVEDGDPNFLHRDEGPDDMSAHIRSSLTDISLTIPVARGRMALGTWQAVYLFEHRAYSMRRRVVLHLLGES